MPNENFWDAVASVLAGLPPELAGLVLVALFLAVIAYSWRRATDEAKKERGKAETASEKLSEHKLDAILSTVNATAALAQEIKTDVEVIRDRGARR